MHFITVVLALALCASCSGQPMTNEDQEQLVALHSVEQQQDRRAESQYVTRIAPKHEPVGAADLEHSEQFNTFVEELQAAGVRNADRRDLRTLSYKELTRLLALWHLAQGRNFYEAADHPNH